MKNEVVQLREMIEEFVKGYNAQMEIKNTEIMQLKKQLFKDGQYQETTNTQVSNFNSFLYPSSEADHESQCRMSLDVIQEVSEYTGSVGQTIRQSEGGLTSAYGSSFPLFSTENQNSGRNAWMEKDDETNK